MSALSAVHASIISFKLGLLEKQNTHLENLHLDVTKVLSDGRTWMDHRNDSQMSYEEVNKTIDEMIFLLSNKGLEASDTSESPKPTSEKQTSSIEGASALPQPGQSSTTTENLTRAGPGHETYHSVVGHETVPGHVKQILSRLDVMETAFSSLKASTEKTSETQAQVQIKMEEITRKQSLMEEQQTQKWADIEKKMKKMGKHSEGMKQQEKRVTSLEKEIEAGKQREMRVTALESEIQTMKKQEKRVTSLENKVVAVNSELHDLEEKAFCKIDKVEKQVDVNTDMVYHVKARTESLSTKAETVEDTAVEDLSNRMDALSTSHDEDRKKLENLEQKTTNIARKINRYQKRTEGKLDEVKTEFKMVCHMVANRLLPLERLRTILNQKIKTRDENVRTLGDVVDKVTDLEQKVSDLENRVPTTTVGFTASFPDRVLTPVPDVNNIIKSFTNIKCNFGNHFDPSTGIFMAPVDGVYVVYCTLFQWIDGRVDVNVKHIQSKSGPNVSRVKWVCGADTWANKTSCSGFGLVRMSCGDSLYVEVVGKEGDVKLTVFSSFSCFKIC